MSKDGHLPVEKITIKMTFKSVSIDLRALEDIIFEKSGQKVVV